MMPDDVSYAILFKLSSYFINAFNPTVIKVTYKCAVTVPLDLFNFPYVILLTINYHTQYVPSWPQCYH